jgi:hypothetical protein
VEDGFIEAKKVMKTILKYKLELLNIPAKTLS